MVVKCGYEGSSRRVNFPSASTCRLDSVRLRVSYTQSLTLDGTKILGRRMLPSLCVELYVGLYR